jgi:glycosyltransferase 2 family protein
MKPSSSARSHWLIRWLARLVTVGLLAWVAWKQDWRALGSLLSSTQGILIFIASVGSMLLGQVCATLRWLTLLRVETPSFSFSRAFKLTLIGVFASLFLPTTAGGDLVRIVGLDDRERAASISVVAMDRIVSVIGVAFLLPLSLFITVPYLEYIQIGMLTGLIVLLAVPEPSGMRRFFSPVVSFLKNLKESLFAWRKHPERLAQALVLAICSNACGWVSVWILAMGLNIQVSYWEIVAMGVWIYAAGFLPFAINGLGVQEALYVYLYALISATPASLAATLALLVRLVYVVAVLPGGIWLFLSPEIRQLLRKPGF